MEFEKLFWNRVVILFYINYIVVNMVHLIDKNNYVYHFLLV